MAKSDGKSGGKSAGGKSDGKARGAKAGAKAPAKSAGKKDTGAKALKALKAERAALAKSLAKLDTAIAKASGKKTGGKSSAGTSAGAAKAAPAISPLAPAAFPDLPAIAGADFAAVAAGVRYKGRADVMLARLAPGTTMAGVFTRSSTRAAPVLWCQERLEALRKRPLKGPLAIVVNSGNANAFTGGAGAASVEAVATAAAKAVGGARGGVFLASTGVIGEPLPHDRIVARLDELTGALGPDAAAAARAIMTTDTFPKGASAEIGLEGETIRVTGFAKGSGMIAPDMATMLGFVFTDAKIAAAPLQTMLREEIDRSFNAITVDSDTSTSDTVLLAATGGAMAREIRSRRDPRAAAVQAAIGAVLRDLAHQVVRDGEGATKFCEITVTGAATDRAAKVIAKAIADSPLVKTAIAGEDPNWGRIVMAVGKSGEAADRDALSIRFGDIAVAQKGWVSPDYREADGAAYMKRAEIEICVDVGVGVGAATVWTCDLTRRYIEINADYRS